MQSNTILSDVSTSSNIDGKTIHIKYTMTFPADSHVIYGGLDVDQDVATTAFKGATTTDMYAGFKTLILATLNRESGTSE